MSFGFSLGDLKKACEWGSWIYETCFTKVNRADVKYFRLGSDIQSLANNLQKLVDVTENAQNQRKKRPWGPYVKFDDCRADLEALSEVTGDFYETLRECQTLLDDRARFRRNKANFVHSVLWHTSTEREVDNLREQVHLHDTKIFFVMKPFEIQLLIGIQSQIQLRDEVEVVKGLFVARHKNDTLGNTALPIHLAVLRREIPEGIVVRFLKALNTNKPESFHKIGDFPLKEGFDALVFHFVKSTVEFNSGIGLGQRVPEETQYINLLKSKWLLDTLRASSHLSAAEPDSLWTNYLGEIEMAIMEEYSRFGTGRLVAPPTDDIARLPDSCFSIWVVEAPSVRSSDVRSSNVLSSDVQSSDVISSHVLSSDVRSSEVRSSNVRSSDLAEESPLEDKILELTLPSTVAKTLTIFRISDIEFRIVIAETVAEGCSKVVERESFKINMESTRLIPVYTIAGSKSNVKNVLLYHIHDHAPLWQSLKTPDDIARFQQSLLGYRVFFDSSNINWSLDGSKNLAKSGVGRVQLWQVKRLPKMIPNDETVIGQYPLSPAPSSQSASAKSLWRESTGRSSMASSFSASSMTSLDTGPSSIASYFSASSMNSLDTGNRVNGIGIFPPEPPVLIIYTLYEEKYTFLHLELTTEISILDHLCYCRKSPKSCPRLVLGVKGGGRMNIRRLSAQEKLEKGLHSWDLARFRLPRHSEYKDIEVLPKVKHMCIDFESIAAKDEFREELAILFTHVRDFELKKYLSEIFSRRQSRANAPGRNVFPGTATLDTTKTFIEKESKTAVSAGAFHKQWPEDGPSSRLRKDEVSQSFDGTRKALSPGFTVRHQNYGQLLGRARSDDHQTISSRPQTILECPFNLLSCSMTFSGQEDWISHSLTHFGTVEPPRLNVCCFCGACFRYSIGLRSWTDCMRHVASHHALGQSLASAQPSLDLFSYLYEHRLITNREYRTLGEKYGGLPPTTRAGLLQSELEDPMNYIREEIEHNVSTFPKDYQNTAFAIDWDFFKYIRQELEEDQNLADILTVSGTAKKAYSTACADYVGKIWPKTGLWMLKILQAVVDREEYRDQITVDAADVVVVDARKVSQVRIDIEVKSPRGILISLAQQLAWLTAISRTPGLELKCSRIHFKHLGNEAFGVSLAKDQQLPKGDEMCWHPLFANTVIAWGFPVPERGAEVGLEISFDVMLHLARISYAVSYDGGLVLSGFSSLLFPTALHKPQPNVEPQSHSVQWHLVVSADAHTRISAGVELAQHDDLWVKIKDEELLRSARTFLGYCRVSCVHLGTENSGFSDVSESSLGDDKPNPAISVRSGNIGTSGMGVFGASMNVEAVMPRGLARLTKIDYYNDILRTAKNMPIILYDADKQQGWLVPALSVILHMAHAWVATHAPEIRLPYAKPDWNGGQAAYDLIADREFSKLELQKSLEDDTPYFLKDLVKRLWEHLISCFDCTILDTRRSRGMIETGHPKLRGWEYMDIVDPPPLQSKMKEQALDRNGCGWDLLTGDVLLLVCKGLGEVIQPAHPNSLCSEVYPVQRGKNYLIASVACLMHLSKRRGKGATCSQLADHVFWPPPPPNLFGDCIHGSEQPCHKIQRLVDKESDGPKSAIDAEGAVLFGHRTNKLRKRIAHSTVNDPRKTMANGKALECADQLVDAKSKQKSSDFYSQPLARREPAVSSSYMTNNDDIPGMSNSALANEQCTGFSNQEKTDQSILNTLAQSTSKAKQGFMPKSFSSTLRRVLN